MNLKSKIPALKASILFEKNRRAYTNTRRPILCQKKRTEVMKYPYIIREKQLQFSFYWDKCKIIFTFMGNKIFYMDLLTTKEAARILGVTTTTVLSWIKKAGIKPAPGQHNPTRGKAPVLYDRHEILYSKIYAMKAEIQEEEEKVNKKIESFAL